MRALLGRLLLDQGQAQPAQGIFQEALRRHTKLGTDEPQLAFTLHGLGASLLALGRIDEPLPVLERACAGAGGSGRVSSDVDLRPRAPRDRALAGPGALCPHVLSAHPFQGPQFGVRGWPVRRWTISQECRPYFQQIASSTVPTRNLLRAR
jgi:hypothetical protein